MNQRNENLKVLVQGYTGYVPNTSKCSCWSLNSIDSSVDDQCHAAVRHLLTTVVSVPFKLLTSTVTWCSTITNTIYCCVRFLIMFQYWAWRICWLDFEIYFDQWEQMFPFHTLAFALWIIVLDPYFVLSDESQISVTSATVTFLSFRIIAQTQRSHWWWA